MPGVFSVLPHIVTIGLLWLAVIIIAGIVKRGLFKGLDRSQLEETDQSAIAEFKEQRAGIERVVSYIRIGATVLALGIAVITILFLLNPFERKYEAMGRIPSATTEESFREPSKEEIDASNKEVIEKKHIEKEEKAEKENQEAMDNAINLFRKASEGTK